MVQISKPNDVFNTDNLPEPGKFHVLELLFRTIRCLASRAAKSTFMQYSLCTILRFSCEEYQGFLQVVKKIDSGEEGRWSVIKGNMEAIERLEQCVNVILSFSNTGTLTRNSAEY